MAHQASRGPILIVEDDGSVRAALTVALERAGYEVRTATNGQEALEDLRTVRSALVVLDLMLPVMDGFEFRVRQRQDPTLASIPVVVLSGGQDVEGKAAGLAVAGCLQKPVALSTLYAVVQSLVDLGGASDAGSVVV
jgi:DNA-binding response OmpR family regulator